MKIIQSFWTKPAFNIKKYGENNYLTKDLYVAALSCLYIKERALDIELVFHTDSLGYDLFKVIPYDSIKLTLDNIPENASNKFFSLAKIYALKNETLDAIHSDHDVFFKDDDVIDVIQNTDWDILCLNQEDAIRSYEDNKNIFKDIKILHPLFSLKKAVSCGIIGFRKQELKDLFINNYFKYLNAILKTANILEVYKLYNPDLTIELSNLAHIIYTTNSKAKTLLSSYNNVEIDILGYEHLANTMKYTTKCINRVRKELEQKDYKLLKTLDKIIEDETKTNI